MMSKNIFNSAWILVITVASFAVSGCSDDSDELQNTNNFNTVCTKWGASKPEVMDYMKNFEMNAMENGYLCYNGKNGTQTISYQFQNEGLLASLLLIPEENISLDELKSSFDDYKYLGEKKGLDIYVSTATNEMVTIGRKERGEHTYFAVGYVGLDAVAE